MNEERLKQFEAMLAQILEERDIIFEQMEELRSKDKSKTVQFKELMIQKMMLQRMLDLYEQYHLI